jgi:hypothetical protein
MAEGQPGQSEAARLMKWKGSISDRYLLRIARLTAKIGKLERELSAERSLRRAVEKLQFSPTQDKTHLANYKRAKTIHANL